MRCICKVLKLSYFGKHDILEIRYRNFGLFPTCSLSIRHEIRKFCPRGLQVLIFVDKKHVSQKYVIPLCFHHGHHDTEDGFY